MILSVGKTGIYSTLLNALTSLVIVIILIIVFFNITIVILVLIICISLSLVWGRERYLVNLAWCSDENIRSSTAAAATAKLA
jgi:uncharacterized membrane protein